MKKQLVRINSKTSSKIARRNIFGAEHIIIEACGAAIAGAVMNSVFYGEDVLLETVNDTTSPVFAPMGHTYDQDGNFVSASSPEGIHGHYCGAVAINWRMVNDLMVCDIAIDPHKAEQTEDGREMLRKINDGECIDMSTAFIGHFKEESGVGFDGEPYNLKAVKIYLDHIAILLDVRGAATSRQGVGVFANSDGEKMDSVSVKVNMSMPAMNMPVAPIHHDYDHDGMIKAIKKYTGSEERPSMNYRRFFLNFDVENPSDFESYQLPYADIIDGKPYVVQAALMAHRAKIEDGFTDMSEKDKAEAIAIIDDYIERIPVVNSLSEDDIDSKVNDESIKSAGGVKNLIKKLLGYNIADDINKDYNEFDDAKINNGDRKMHEFILNALKAAGINTDGMSDAEVGAQYNALQAKNTADAVKSAVEAAVAPLQEEITTIKQNSAETEASRLTATKKDLFSKIKLNGLTEEMALAMDVAALEVLVKNNSAEQFEGQVAFNASTGLRNAGESSIDGMSLNGLDD